MFKTALSNQYYAATLASAVFTLIIVVIGLNATKETKELLQFGVYIGLVSTVLFAASWLLRGDKD